MPAAALEVFISRAFDVAVGALCHSQLPLPPAPGAFGVSVEMIATQAWGPGLLTGSNKLTSRELQNGVPFCLGDHDIGPLIPDVTVPWPSNANYAIAWPFSSRKMLFQSTIVQTEGKPTACAQPGPIPLPMMTCGDPCGAPTALEVSNFIANTKIGMSGGDIVAGVIKCAAAMVIDLIFYGISRGVADRRALRAAMEGAEAVERSVARQIADGIAGKLVPTSWTAAAKAGVTAVTNFGISALEGNPTFQLKIGAAPVGEVGVGWREGEGWGAGATPAARGDDAWTTGSGPWAPPSSGGGSS
jgi:hypothetical protein